MKRGLTGEVERAKEGFWTSFPRFLFHACWNWYGILSYVFEMTVFFTTVGYDFCRFLKYSKAYFIRFSNT